MSDASSACRFIFPLEHLYWQLTAQTIDAETAQRAFRELDRQIRNRLDESERVRLQRLSRAYRQLSRQV